MLHITVRRFTYETKRVPYTASESGRQPESPASILRLDVNVSRAIRFGVGAMVWFQNRPRSGSRTILADTRVRTISGVGAATGLRQIPFFGYALLERNAPTG